ncbi:MAG: sulfite exporter TauE/SafE family protein [Hyphomicrobiaceae bacterium]|nr:sulfite exporter TauE/SafE family protein [Hyphomicrobiaceae bacterium]
MTTALQHLSVQVVVVIVLAFAFAGIVKGTIGAGLPATSVPILVMVLEPSFAVALTLVPVAFVNIWQALQGTRYREAFREFWSYLLTLAVGAWFGAKVLVSANPKLVAFWLGIIVVSSTALQALAPRGQLSPKRLALLNPFAGGGMGLIGGSTGIFVPSIIYFAVLRLQKDLFISLMALVALIGMAPLYAGLVFGGILDWNMLYASILMVAPAAMGYLIGTNIRHRLADRTFRLIVWIVLTALGLNLIRLGLL